MTVPPLLTAEPVRYSAILGFGGFRGERVVTNDEVAEAIDSSDEWIRQRTGIRTRTYAAADTSVADMAESAARRALENAGIRPDQVGAVIVGTVTHFVQTPSLACIVADRIGVTPAAAFDISAACAGFTYGIAQADALVRAGTVEYVVVVGVEKMSDYVDPTDRSISFILGDGAGAAVVGPSDTPRIGRTVWGADGSRAEAVSQSRSWLDLRGAADPAAVFPYLRQDGPSVFKWATFTMTPVAAQAIEAAGLTPDQIDVFIPHQANMRIIDHMVKHLELREDVIVGRDIVETGNTSAASVPLAAERLLREGEARSGDVALLIGFGAGLAYAAQVVVLP